MTLTESKCIRWSISDIFSSKCLESSTFSVFNKYYSLFLKLNTSEDAQKDEFTLGLKSQNRENYLTPRFSVTTFIQDELSNIHFFQEIGFNEIFALDSTSFWHVKRSDILSISERLNLPCLKFVILFSPEENHYPWINILEKKCEKQIEKDTAHKMMQTDFQLTSPSCMESLSGDFCNLLKNETETDMTFRCGDKTFRVHKTILSARSDVFAAMFRNNLSEKRDGIVEIADTDPDILKEFLQYVYTGILFDINEDTATALYSIAHKYAIDALQARCGTFLVENLTEANACNYLILSDVHDDNNLKNRIISFIRHNGQILSREEWLKFSDDHPKLSNEVYRILYKNISPVIS